jgi:transcriptional regulator with AAA-type ATPase domain/tRNA A-37 threonylcarbamoyl transferase component Bud32
MRRIDGARAAPAAFEHARYAAGEELGRGAQGVVVRVVDREAPARALVAKVWRGEAFRAQALLGEYALLSRARIPGLVRAHDLARCARTGAVFLVEDFIDGPEAATWVEEAATATRAGRLLAIVTGVAATLALLHDAGFSHGDLKPVHVRVVGDGAAARPVLLDLGAAVGRAREPMAEHAFTPAFAAPEVRAGGAPSALADLYGLGALAWSIASGRPPESAGNTAKRLREQAPWVPPSAADLIAALVAEHPRDRPDGARAVLLRAGAAQRATGLAVGRPPAPIGRDRELTALLARQGASVRYVVGPSGVGKSHLVRELLTRALLQGRDARLLRLPGEAAPILARLTAFLRDRDLALPFVEAGAGPLLLVLDDLHLAPAELAAAVDAYRCRGRERGVTIVATAPSAPDGAEALTLGPLDDAGFEALCRALGIDEAARIAEARAASGKVAGWLVAAATGVPLTRDAVLDRVRGLSTEATALLGAAAQAGGEIDPAFCARIAGESWEFRVAELLGASLLARRAEPGALRYVLSAPALARDLAAALVDFDLADRVGEALLADPTAAASALLSAAGAEAPPSRREDLLARAADQARVEEARSLEIEALFALLAEPRARTSTRLRRLERLARDGGTAAMHPQVLGWLDEAATLDRALLPLALRRHAEQRARTGDVEGARSFAARAIAAAAEARDPAAEALALATTGLVALYRADWTEAARAIGDARARLAALADLPRDPEEVARVDHNLGVIALYQGRNAEAIHAFERSLAVKRGLGDRGGVRSCLLNLGLALAKAARFAEADRALEESGMLARSLGQSAGRAWCFAARADVAVRRKDAAAAAGWIAEAEVMAGALPAAIQADLVILRAEVALLERAGARAIAALATLDPALRAANALVDARAFAIEASAHLATLPVDTRRAARLAIAGVRRARGAALPEAEAEALAALGAARAGRAFRYAPPMTSDEARAPTGADDPLWAWLAQLAGGASPGSAAIDLARLLAAAHGAERCFIAAIADDASIVEAWGADLDGLPLAEAGARLDAELVRLAAASATPVYLRDVATRGGRGARLAVAAPEPAGGGRRALVVLEHRFSPFAFDRVSAAEAARWITLAALLLRLDEPAPDDVEAPVAAASTGPRRVRALPSPAPDDLTTAFPAIDPDRVFPGILGRGPAMTRALARLSAAVDSELPVLVLGETGSGKELFARALHELGRRASRPFVALNCGAVPDALFEAELFGHARGSFTGAERARPGLVARAEKGTLFLDEIGELPLLRQAALLRALESRRYRPVGSDEEIPFDVRIVAATNRDLEACVAERTFRQDLLYRLNAVSIRVPPLRERTEDLPALCRAFLDHAGGGAELSPEAEIALAAYAWPGNVRELEHLMQRLASLKTKVISIDHLPRPLRARTAQLPPPRAATTPGGERAEVERAMTESGGNISRAAVALGLTRHGLKKRMVRLGMRAEKVK